MTVLREHCLIHVIWCDDIRQEVGNKPSFMGVYNHLGVPSVPLVLPRLAAFVTIYTPIGKPLSNVTLRVVKSDEEKEIAFAELSGLGAPTEVHVSMDPGEQPSVRILSIAMLLGNIQINESTRWLKVYAKIGDEQLESLKLRILRPSSSPQQT